MSDPTPKVEQLYSDNTPTRADIWDQLDNMIKQVRTVMKDDLERPAVMAHLTEARDALTEAILNDYKACLRHIDENQ